MLIDTSIEIRKEIDLLKQLLESLGFSVIKDYDSPDNTLIIYRNDLIIGDCRVRLLSEGIAINTLLMPKYLPEEIINQLLLLGFEHSKDNLWLRYKIVVKDATYDYSAKTTE